MICMAFLVGWGCQQGLVEQVESVTIGGCSRP